MRRRGRLGLLTVVVHGFSVEGSRLLATTESNSTPAIQEDFESEHELKCSKTKNALYSESPPNATCNRGVLNIPFNSRTYFYDDRTMFQSDGEGCDAAERNDDQQCSSYTKGGFFLSGKVLEFDLDLSRTECGCNAAIYLVGMPTNDERSTCGDHYCDASGICGTFCTEIDVMEANQVAWKTVIHHESDRFGEQYGWGRWMTDEHAFFRLDDNVELYFECLYGPSTECAINTNLVFHASFVFSDTSTASFSFQTILSQEGRSITATAIQYTTPTKSTLFANKEELSVDLSNQRLAQSVDDGLTLVASYWGGPNVDSLEWLDVPCSEDNCVDVFTYRDWPWVCSGSGKANCHQGYRISNIEVSSVEDFDYNAGVKAKNITSFFAPEFDPTNGQNSVPTMRDRFMNVKSNPEAFLWTPLHSTADWIIFVLYALGTGALNLYSFVRLNNILRAILSTRFFRAKAKVGGIIPKGKEPEVTLQICCYNERNVIKSTINAACAVDWPRSKLFVQVLDDSNDESVEVIEQTCARLRDMGYNCHRLERPNRIGYKAGNLQSHFNDIRGEFVGLFDSDHLCDSEFLRRCMPHFFDEQGRPKPKVGLVQCPWGYYNIHQNLLTEYDALNLDTAFVIEQTARDAFLGTFSFNGTGGLWRKQAIADVGGWSWETVTEDLYISYQAAMAGYKFVYLRDLPQVLEVPANIRAHLQQKNRWTKGYWQVTRKTLGKILWNPKTPIMMKFEIVFQYTASSMYAWTLLLVILSPVLTYLQVYSPFMICLSLFPAAVAIFAGVVTVFGKDAGNHSNNYRILLARCLRLRFIPLLLLFALGVMIFECYAIFQGLTSDDATFLRTPKEGAPRDDKEEGDDESVEERIDYNMRFDSENHNTEPDASDLPPTKHSNSSCGCFRRVTEKEKNYRNNLVLGWSGILLALYLVVWSVWLYMEQYHRGSIELCMIFSLSIPALGLCWIHGSYLLQLRASRIQIVPHIVKTNEDVKTNGDVNTNRESVNAAFGPPDEPPSPWSLTMPPVAVSLSPNGDLGSPTVTEKRRRKRELETRKAFDHQQRDCVKHSAPCA